MEGTFADWFIVTGTEYYKNDNIKFVGEYNKGPRNYYSPDILFLVGYLMKKAKT
ncbi:hypothetical protein [Clostridium sp.]